MCKLLVISALSITNRSKRAVIVKLLIHRRLLNNPRSIFERGLYCNSLYTSTLVVTRVALPHKKSNPGGLLDFYQRSSSETESFLRAWRRRALRTRRPLALAILARKPCLFTRLRREGWNVLFMICLFYIFSRKDCKGSNSGGICQIFLEISRLRSK